MGSSRDSTIRASFAALLLAAVLLPRSTLAVHSSLKMRMSTCSPRDVLPGNFPRIACLLQACKNCKFRQTLSKKYEFLAKMSHQTLHRLQIGDRAYYHEQAPIVQAQVVSIGNLPAQLETLRRIRSACFSDLAHQSAHTYLGLWEFSTPTHVLRGIFEPTQRNTSFHVRWILPMETALIIPSLLPIDLTASGRTRRNLAPIRLTRIAPGAYVESLAPIRALSWYIIFAQPRPDSALPSPLVVFHAE